MGGENVFDYYYGQESEQFSFFRIPRVLVKDQRFAKLSSDAKLLYGLLLDRMSLSQSNGWIDDENRVYIIYTIQEITEDLSCGKDKAVKIMAELDTKKGIGLVEKKRRGLGQPTLLYVKNFVSEESTNPVKSTEVGKTDFKSSEKPNSRSRKSRIQDFGKIEFKKSEKPDSRGLENRIQEVGFSDPNYTDYNQTEGNQTQSIDPSLSTQSKERFVHHSMDEIDRDETGAIIALIKENIEYEHHMQYDDHGDRERYDELFRVIIDTVFGQTERVRIGECEFPYEIVRSRFLKLKSEHLEYVRRCIAQNTGEIRNMKKYMLAALYNAPSTIDTYYTQRVNHDFHGSVGE